VCVCVVISNSVCLLTRTLSFSHKQQAGWTCRQLTNTVSGPDLHVCHSHNVKPWVYPSH